MTWTACATGRGAWRAEFTETKRKQENKWRATHSYLKENPQLLVQNCVGMISWGPQKALVLAEKEGAGQALRREGLSTGGMRAKPGMTLTQQDATMALRMHTGRATAGHMVGGNALSSTPVPAPNTHTDKHTEGSTVVNHDEIPSK